MGPGFIPMAAGQRYGRLTLVRDRRPGDRSMPVRCECGSELAVSTGNLRSGNTQSCGCIKLERIASLKARHGLAGSRIYNIWCDMVARCTRPTHPRYVDYGGRGITVCERWLDFVNFYTDMGHRPAGRSLDRRNNDCGYSPENCRWATASEQNSNRRRASARVIRKAEEGVAA
jgi:hypothetical protein